MSQNKTLEAIICIFWGLLAVAGSTFIFIQDNALTFAGIILASILMCLLVDLAPSLKKHHVIGLLAGGVVGCVLLGLSAYGLEYGFTVPSKLILVLYVGWIFAAPLGTLTRKLSNKRKSKTKT